MKLFIFLLLFSTSVAAWDVEVTRHRDGDTFDIQLPLPEPLNKAAIRILGIDTPEKRGKCEKERQGSAAATQRLIELIPVGTIVTLTNFKWDKFGGRINADVFIDGVDVGSQMIEEGHAIPYTGRGPKHDWCQ